MARIAKQNIREKILEAAEKRLWHYGIKKTTIDEIAADAGVGKGTVYLYFDSKEDITLAIFVEYKLGVQLEQEKILLDPTLDLFGKIRQFLVYPILRASSKCAEFPEALDLIKDLKPRLAEHMRPYLDEEVALLAKILQDGVVQGQLDVTDFAQTARSLKFMTLGFMPPYPCVDGPEAIEHEIDSMVRLAMRGLRSRSNSLGTEAVESELIMTNVSR